MASKGTEIDLLNMMKADYIQFGDAISLRQHEDELIAVMALLDLKESPSSRSNHLPINV